MSCIDQIVVHRSCISVTRLPVRRIRIILSSVWETFIPLMANSANQDQTAPEEQSDHGVHYLFGCTRPNVLS